MGSSNGIKSRPPQQGPQGLFEGRVLAITILVGVAIASFILGYFVGGATGRRPQPQSDLYVMPSTTAPAATEPRMDNAVTQAQQAAPLAEEPRFQLPKPSGAQGTEAEEPAETKAASSASATKASKQKETQKESKEQKAKRQSAVAEESSASTGGYIVQVGAFKTLSDAEAQKKKFTDKGYKASVYRDKGSDGKTIFKVKLGPYKDRDTANQVATKAKSLSGTTPFVAANK